MTDKTDADKDKTAEVAKAAKPVPSQNKVDDIREEAVAEADVVTTAATDDGAPYPSQADLDAIREGKFLGREVKASGAGAKYKTR